MKIKISVASFLFVILLFLAGASGCLAAMEKTPDDEEVCLIADEQDVPRMPVDELKSRLNDPSLIIIDVRTPGEWNASSMKIKGAFREVLKKVEEWAPKYQKDKTIVLYCT